LAKRHDRVLLLALVLSGCAALGDEIMWTRLATLMLGSETMGVLAVLAGFFGGMAIGAAVLHKRAAYGPDPIGLFVRLELATAGFAALAPLVLPWLAEHVPAWLGPIAGDNSSPRAIAIGIAIAGAALLPGSFCMGATLAAVVEARRRSVMSATGPQDDDSLGVGRIYAANTFGAVLGVLGTIHFVLPALGVGWGSLVLATFSALAALLALRWGVRHPASRRPALAEVREPKIDTSRDPDPDVQERFPLLVVVTGAGFVGVGLEVIGVLVLSQLLENTIYTFAHVLAVYLLGTAVGAWLWARFGPPLAVGRPAMATAALLVALALSCVLAAAAIANARGILDGIAGEGASAAMHMFAEACVAAAVFGVPTMLMGALFSHVMGLIAPRGIGLAYALNTLGSAIAPFVFGVAAVVELGYRDAFFVTVYGYLLLFGAFTWYRRFKPVQQIGAIVLVIAITFVGPSSLVLVEADEGWTTLAQHETPMGLVSVSEKKASDNEQKARGYVPLRRLRLGQHFRMGGSVAFGERRMGHLALLLHGAPERALFLGIGTGATLSAVRAYPLERVDAVELIPKVVDELHQFATINLDVADDPRVAFHKADARRFVTATQDEYDVIVADLFHPGLDGAGGLYAHEHFEHVAARLAPGGLFVQWLPLYQFDDVTLRSVIGTFCDVFPEVHSMLGIYNVQHPAVALVGRVPEGPDDRLRIDVDALASKLQEPVFTDLLMQDPRDLLGAYMLDRDALVELAGDAPRNTDLRPVITLRAPRVSYEGAGRNGVENLRTLLDRRTPLAVELLTGDGEAVASLHAESARFAAALQAYLEGEELRSLATKDVVVPDGAIDAYLRAYAIAPEFTPARGLLYDIAKQRAAWAERILPAMLEATPDEPRVWKTWIAFLRRQGDEARLAEAEAEAQARFGAASSP
jgi:spermidine synthase